MGNLVRVEQGAAPVSLGSCTGKLCLTFWVPFLAASAAALCPLPQRREVKAGTGRGFLLSTGGLKGSVIHKLPLSALWPVR